MSGGTFERYEIKYLLDSRQRRALEIAMKEHMQEDQYGESTICSLYYDTPDFRLVRRSLEKPIYKEKLRVRSYGAVRPEDSVFVELKKKYDGIVYKRRIAMKEMQAEQYLAGRAPLPEDCQIGRELEWFLRFYRELAPVVYLCYDRIAYFCPENEELRVTFDRNVRWRTEELTLASAPWGEPLLSSGQSLLEIKAASAMPLWLVKALSDNHIRQASFSKYGSAYTIICERETLGKRGVHCA